MCPEFAVHGLPDGAVVWKREADSADGGGGHQCGEDQARQREEFDSAGPQLAERVGVGTQLAAGEYGQFEAASGIAQDVLRGLIGAHVHGVRGG
ncbi:hypothetical protein D9M68_764790 [compost metagenome]